MYRNVFLGAILLSMPLVVWSQQDTIADQRLEEIMVTAKLPLVEISAGKTSYRMDASVTQSTGSLYDVLASLPGVVIDSNGNILLNGQSGATILMDGKPTYSPGYSWRHLHNRYPSVQDCHCRSRPDSHRAV